MLLTNSAKLAEQMPAAIEKLLSWLPTAEIARQAWQNCGEIIVCDTREEMVQEADRSRPNTCRYLRAILIIFCRI